MVPSSVYQENLVAVVIDVFYIHACMSSNFGKQRNKLHSALDRKPCTPYHVPDVFFLPFPLPFSPAHAHHKEKYGWLARLAAVVCWSLNSLPLCSCSPHNAQALSISLVASGMLSIMGKRELSGRLYSDQPMVNLGKK